MFRQRPLWLTITKKSRYMPAGYEKIRDAFISKGMSTKAAKTKAAKIWNSKHKGKSAVGRYT